MLVNCIAYKNGHRLAEIKKNQISDYLKDSDILIWVALQDPTLDELLNIKKQFILPELAVEDATHGHQRPKIEEYSDCVFAVLRLPTIVDDEIMVGELSIFVGNNYVLSIRKNISQGFGHVRERLERDPELLKIGPGIIFYALIDGVVDFYFPIIYTLENELDILEERIFNERASRTLVRKLYNLKSKVILIKHSFFPLLADISKTQGERAPKVFHGIQNYFRDVSDHLNRISTSVDSIIETINMAMHANISLIAIEDSQINKKLAAWAGIFAVATAFVGIWGMNFDFMPELKWKFGYPISIGLIVGICGYLYYRFRKSGWL